MSQKLGLHGRKISGGVAEGEALVTKTPLSFLSSVMRVDTGEIVLGGHELEGKSVKGKILVYPSDYMSTYGAFGLLSMATIYKTAPAGIIWKEAHNISASAAIYVGIPGIDRIKEGNPCELIETGDRVRIDADKGVVEVTKKTR
jgi:predicted aconitase with swiveling domain